MHIETEFKALISQEQYSKILSSFRFPEEQTQVNSYYLDNEGTLAGGDITVRVREKNGKYLLQVKIRRGNENGISTAEEYESEISGTPELLDASLLPVRLSIPHPFLRRAGELTTHRRVIRRNGYELCLDRNEYLGLTDYELEVEFTGDAPTEILRVLSSLGVHAESSAKGKRGRFFDALEKNRAQH